MPPNPTKALRDLLLWARKERIVLSSVTLGGVTVEIAHDYGLQTPAGKSAPPEHKANIIEQHAGVLAPYLRGEAPDSPEALQTLVEEDE